MILLIVLGLDLSGVPKKVKRKFNQGMKPMLNEIGQFWHRKIRPSHFSGSAKTKYQYGKRDREYEQDKKERKGNRPDLLYSGKLNRYTKYAPRITSTSKQVTVKMDVPAGRKNQDQINKEITAVNQSDTTTMANRLLKKSEALIKKLLRK